MTKKIIGSKNSKRVMMIMFCSLMLTSTDMSAALAAVGDGDGSAPAPYANLEAQGSGMINELRSVNSMGDFSSMNAALLSLHLALGSASASNSGDHLLAALLTVNTATVDMEQSMNRVIDQVGAAYGSNNGLGPHDGRGQTSVRGLRERMMANLEAMKEQAKQAKQGIALKLKTLLEENSENGSPVMPLSPQERSEILREWARTDPQSLSSVAPSFSPEIAGVAQEVLRIQSAVRAPAQGGLSSGAGELHSASSWGEWNDRAARVINDIYTMYGGRGPDRTPLISLPTTGLTNVPTTGSATYDGAVVAFIGSTVYAGTKLETAAHLLTVNFASRSVNGGFYLASTAPDTSQYTISLNGAISPGSNILSGTISGQQISNGSFKGSLYGIQANRIGASFTGIVGDYKLHGTIAAVKI